MWLLISAVKERRESICEVHRHLTSWAQKQHLSLLLTFQDSEHSWESGKCIFPMCPGRGKWNRIWWICIVVATVHSSVCHNVFFIYLTMQKTHSILHRDENQKTNQSLQSAQAPKFLGDTSGPSSSLDMVPLGLRIYEIKRKIVSPRTHTLHLVH